MARGAGAARKRSYELEMPRPAGCRPIRAPKISGMKGCPPAKIRKSGPHLCTYTPRPKATCHAAAATSAGAAGTKRFGGSCWDPSVSSAVRCRSADKDRCYTLRAAPRRSAGFEAHFGCAMLSTAQGGPLGALNPFQFLGPTILPHPSGHGRTAVESARHRTSAECWNPSFPPNRCSTVDVGASVYVMPSVQRSRVLLAPKRGYR